MDALSIFVMLAAVVFVAIPAAHLVRGYLRWRQARLVVCPGSNESAIVELDALATAAQESPRGLTLKSCSRWPEHRACGQECLEQLSGSGREGVVRELVHRLYLGRHCSLCSAPFGSSFADSSKAGFIDSEGHSRAWQRVPAESLQAAFSSMQPICRRCLAAELAQAERDAA